MDISDKIITVCIIFAILAILSVVFGCYYFSIKTENFKEASNTSEEKNMIKQIIELLASTNTPDKLILDLMKKNKAFFKNEKFINKIIEELKKKDNFTDKPKDKPKETTKDTPKEKASFKNN
jgi:L-cystine uptake protein TcyP (sodium:dicarboxylate symporter family)